MAEEIVDEVFRRARGVIELKKLVEAICKKYKVRYEFVEKIQTELPLAFNIYKKVILIDIVDMDLKVFDIISSFPEAKAEDIIETLIKHEVAHSDLIKKLIERGYTEDYLARIYFAFPEEIYVSKRAPEHWAVRLWVHDVFMDLAITESGRYEIYRRTKVDPFLLITLSEHLDEEEIKGLFGIEYPTLVESLLFIKKLAPRIETVDDVIVVAERLKEVM